MLARRPNTLAALAASAALASCAHPPPAASPALAQAATSPAGSPKASPRHCGFAPLSNRFRPGEDLQFVFSVKANSQWCFDGFAISGLSTTGQAIQEAPSHGEVRLVPRPGVIIFGYRPEPGYIGSDHFRISVPSQVEASYFAGSVTVTP